MSLKKIYLSLTLIDDLVLSAQAATVGDHETLDYIPGSVLRGIAASHLYRDDDLGDIDLETYIHRDGIRFMDALPVDAKAGVGFPVPLSWHVPKMAAEAAAFEFGSSLQDFASLTEVPSQTDEGDQYKQLRNGYAFLSDGNRVAIQRPQTTYRMKTAIDPTKGRAAKSQLFGYQALMKGQRFYSEIAYTDDRVAEKLKAIFAGKLRIGRSRSAEYGRVLCEISDAPIQLKSSPPPNAGKVVCVALSDLQLKDEFSQPTYEISPQTLGLGDNVIIDNVFMRTRRSARYNAALRCREKEDFLIRRGSVFTLSGLDEADFSKLTDGVGHNKSLGYGRLWVNPDFSNQLTRVSIREKTLHSVSQRHQEDTQFVAFKAFLNRTVGKGSYEAERAWVSEVLSDLEIMYGYSFELARVTDNYGPSRTQWMRVEKAKESRNFFNDLFEGNDAICGQSDTKWSVEALLDGELISFRNYLKSRFEEKSGEQSFDLKWAFSFLARKASKCVEDFQKRGEAK